MVRFDVAQWQDIDIKIVDLPAANRHLIAQVAFNLHPVIGRRFPYDHEQVIGYGVAESCTASEFAEQQDVFRVENTARQVLDDLRRFGGVVEFRAFRQEVAGIVRFVSVVRADLARLSRSFPCFIGLKFRQ